MLKIFCLHLKDALTAIISHEATPPPDGSPTKNENPRVQIMKHYTRLLLAFHFCRSDICRGDKEPPKDLINDSNRPSDRDRSNFVSLLRSLLEKRKTSMYSSPVPKMRRTHPR
jgi:hypothetical protein